MTPSEQIDAFAEAYYTTLHEGDRSQSWERQSEPRKEKHRRAVRALLLRQMEIEEASMDGHVVFVPPPGLAAREWIREPARMRLIERLKQRRVG